MIFLTIDVDPAQRVDSSVQPTSTVTRNAVLQVGVCPPSPWERDIMEQNARWLAKRGQRMQVTDRILEGVLAEKALSERAVPEVTEEAQYSDTQGASAPIDDDWNELDREEPVVRAAIIAGWQDSEAAKA